ncbi:putative uncharacterized protein [Coprobacillus sp. CAG:826]|jgi:Cof subfamily protein (haloacid dehalogenase superfamily)|nr:HAD family phosphatase [Coprobacillus sp.]CDD92278.1 putative uncharacterized protein [Coprobacillus sp. CAG:826]
MRKVLATDLDGTLFYPRRKISMIAKRNYRMLEGHFAKQGKVVIVTGRNVPFSKKVAKKLKHDIDIIACSGSYVEAEGKILKDEVLPGGVGQDIYDILDQKIPGFVVSVLGRNGEMVIHHHQLGWLKSLVYSWVYFYQGVYAEKHVKGEKALKEMMHHNQVYKLLFYFGLGEKGHQKAVLAKDILKEKYPNLEYAVEDSILEITHEGCNKAKGLEILCEYYQLEKENLVVIGDSENDVPMFQAFPNSVCMSHASAAIKKQAKYNVHHFDEVEKYLEGDLL